MLQQRFQGWGREPSGRHLIHGRARKRASGGHAAQVPRIANLVRDARAAIGPTAVLSRLRVPGAR